MQQRRNHAAQPPGLVRIVGQAGRHDQAAEVRIAQPQRPEAMAIGGDLLRRIAGVVDQDFLGDKHHPARRLEPLGVERAVVAAELHQVDARQVARRVVDEHVFGARVAGVDPARVRAGVPAVDRRIVLHARIAATPGRIRHLGEHLPGRIAGPGLARIGNPMGGPGLIGFDRFHEVVAKADGKVGVLEEHRVVGLLRIVALLDQRADLLLLAVLALDELHHVGMPVLDRLHFGGPAGLAAALYYRRNLVVYPHERQRPRGLAAAGELLAMRTQRGKVGARARAELEEHGFAAGQLHDVFHVVLHALDKARRRLRILVRVLGLNGLARPSRPSASCTSPP